MISCVETKSRGWSELYVLVVLVCELKACASASYRCELYWFANFERLLALFFAGRWSNEGLGKRASRGRIYRLR